MRFWILCSTTLLSAVAFSWLGYRLKSEDLGVKSLPSEFVIALVVAALQALLLFAVWRLLRWTHWLQYLVASAFTVIGYKFTHTTEMESYGPFVVAIVQFGLFFPALRILEPIFGDLARRFPMFA